MNVFVTESDTPCALSVIRNLGENGINIHTGGFDKCSPGLYSKYIKNRVIYRYCTSKGIDGKILETIKKYKCDILFPIYEEFILNIYKNKKKYEKYTKIIPLPNEKVFKLLIDKSKFYNFAKKNDILIPKTIIIHNLKNISIKNLKYPLIIKPAKSRGAKATFLANNAKELKEKIEIIEKIDNKLFFNKNKIIIQEFIEGNIICSFFLFQNGKMIVSHQHKTLKLNKEPCGYAAVNQSFYDVKLERISLDIIKKIKFDNGLIGFQFIYDKINNKYYVIDPVPRIFGSLNHALKLGIDYPLLMCRIANKENLEKMKVQNKMITTTIYFNMISRFLFTKKISDFKILLTFKNTDLDFKDFKPHIIQLCNGIIHLSKKMFKIKS